LHKTKSTRTFRRSGAFNVHGLNARRALREGELLETSASISGVAVAGAAVADANLEADVGAAAISVDPGFIAFDGIVAPHTTSVDPLLLSEDVLLHSPGAVGRLDAGLCV